MDYCHRIFLYVFLYLIIYVSPLTWISFPFYIWKVYGAASCCTSVPPYRCHPPHTQTHVAHRTTHAYTSLPLKICKNEAIFSTLGSLTRHVMSTMIYFFSENLFLYKACYKELCIILWYFWTFAFKHYSLCIQIFTVYILLPQVECKLFEHRIN